MREAERIIDSARHHLGQAALAILQDDGAAAQRHMNVALGWAKQWDAQMQQDLAEDYRRLVDQGRAVRLRLNGGETTNADSDVAGWILTDDRMGATMTRGEATYVVHVQPSRRQDPQWRWGVGDGVDTAWGPECFATMAEAQDHVEQVVAAA